MILAEVTGKVVATTKCEGLVGKKLLIAERLDENNKKSGQEFVSADAVGAGVGDIVLITVGSSARSVFNDRNTPVDSSIVAIVDTIQRG